MFLFKILYDFFGVLMVANVSGMSKNIVLDHFIEDEHGVCAGKHVIIDCYDAEHLSCQKTMHQAFLDMIEACGATLLHIHLHVFGASGGISGVAVLAESHISVHTWPENHYAAFDVFMCGNAKPHQAVDVIQAHFKPKSIQVNEIRRGALVENQEES